MFAQCRVINWNYTGTEQVKGNESGKWKMQSAGAIFSVNYSQVEQQLQRASQISDAAGQSSSCSGAVWQRLNPFAGTQPNG